MSRLATQPARASGEFAIGGDLPVVRLGYGAMQIPGPGVCGEPRDHDEVIRVLRRAIELAVTFIDTADSYGPEVSERPIREALHPYPDDLVIATKAGLTRPGPGRWGRNGKPEYLKAQAEKSLRLLGLERIELIQHPTTRHRDLTAVETANPGGPVMNDLLATVIEAHGGLERWTQLETVSARLVQSGALWALKGQQGALDDVFVTASLHEERASHHPFGAPDRRSAFTPERVAIETDKGDVVEALEQPRASFAGHTLETLWTTLQLAYFVGTAMWTYLTQPFTFALPGFETTELERWQEAGERWRRLHVLWPSYLATHSSEQTLYFGEDGLIRRHDYNVEIMGGNSAAHYISDYTRVAGIMIPTKHRIFPRAPSDEALGEPLIVSRDVSEIAFT